MIGFLRGRVVEVGPEALVLDVSGVGYELQCSSNTLDTVLVGEDLSLQVHTHVREDAITLFGFASALEKRLFLSLVKVNGVGPKLAIKALSAGPVEHLVQLIEAGDVKGLSGLPKIGKKTAEQIILTLKGKLVLDDDTKLGAGGRARLTPQPRSDLFSALVNLGFKPQDVERVVAELPADADLQTNLRQGLQALTGQF